MKVRNGFVSNSSSSSFVVTNQTVRAFAEQVVKLMYDDSSEGYINSKEWKALKTAECKKLNPNIPIRIATCNYDTYIYPFHNYLIVSTCNNYDWSGIDTTRYIPNNLIKILTKKYNIKQTDDVLDAIAVKIEYDIKYWDISYNKLFKLIPYNKLKDFKSTCQHTPFSYVANVKTGKPYCIECQGKEYITILSDSELQISPMSTITPEDWTKFKQRFPKAAKYFLHICHYN